MKKKGTQQQNTSSAQDYRKEAKLHMAAIKSSWVIFAKTGVVVLAAAVVIFVATVAWFANNREVQANNMAIQMAGSVFELAAQGDIGKWDTEERTPAGEEVILDGSKFLTTGQNSTILWALNDNSHMNNQKEVGTGLQPGSSGSLTCYIIAKTTGPLSVNLSLQILGELGELQTEEQPIPQDALELLQGHILFFAGYDSGTSSYIGWISSDADSWKIELENGQAILQRNEDGSLTWSRNVESEKAYPITFYWIWPDIFGEYLFKNQTHIARRSILFPYDQSESVATASVLPSRLFKNICQTKEGEVSNRYMKWARTSDADIETQRTEFMKLVTEENLQGLRNETGYNLYLYGKICNYYNRGDQYIGEQIPYIRVSLEAD